MAIQVESYAGYRGEQEPRVLFLGERRLEVIEIVDRWMEPGRRWFKCRAGDGNTYILRHDEASGEWQLAAFTRSA